MELKSRIETLRKQIQEKDVEISKLKSLKITFESDLARHQDHLHEIKIEKDAALVEAQKKLNKIRADSTASTQRFESEVTERELRIDTLRNEIARINSKIQPQVSTTEVSFNDRTLEQEQEDEQMKVKEKKELLENLYHELNDLNNEIDLVRHQLEEVSKHETDLKCKLFEAQELLDVKEIEVSALSKSVNDAMTVRKEISLFDEVNRPREELMKKYSFLKDYSKYLEAQVDDNRTSLLTLCSLKFELEEAIENQPIEYEQDLEKSAFNYNVYIKTLNRFCQRLKHLLSEKEVLLNRWLKEDIGYFYMKLCEEHQKYENDALEHAYAEYRVMKLKSMDIREAVLQIAKEKEEFAKLNEEYNNKKVIKTVNTSEIKDVVVSECVKVVEDVVTVKKNDKKVVKFKENIEPNVNAVQERKGGGKVLQYKTIHINELKKKKL